MQQMLSLRTLNVVTKLRTKKCYTVLSLGFLKGFIQLGPAPFQLWWAASSCCSFGPGAQPAGRAGGGSLQGIKNQEKKKKNLPNRTNPQIYNPNSNYRYVQLLSKKIITVSQRQSTQSGILPITLTQVFVCKFRVKESVQYESHV